MVSPSGQVDSRFESVARVFSDNFARRGDVGAGLCVYLDGRPAVDLCDGTSDPSAGAGYDHATLQLVFSATKGITSACAAVLVDRGLLDLDAPVCRYWPEFGEAGKRDVTIADVMSHRAGLVAVDRPLTTDEVLAVGPVVDALAAQEPMWKPGTAHGYHAFTFGWLVGEIVRRVDGRTIGAFIADELATPLGLDLWIGLPESQLPRVAPMILPTDTPVEELAVLARALSPGSIGARALTLDGAIDWFGGDEFFFNRTDVLATEMPAANAVTTARSLARLYAATLGPVDGAEIVGRDTMRRMTTEASRGRDPCLTIETAYGMGFALDCEAFRFTGPRAYGHYGAGGSCAFADPDLGIAFAYAMNQIGTWYGPDRRVDALLEAVVAAAASTR